MPTETEKFEEFQGRRNAERETAARNRVVFRKATLPRGPRGTDGYVGRLGETETRSYIVRDLSSYEFGRLVGADLVPLGVRKTLAAARVAATEALFADINPLTEGGKGMASATATRPRAAKKPTEAKNETKAETAPDELRTELRAKVMEIDGVEVEKNKDERYERFKIAGARPSFVLLYAPSKSGVRVQIPRALLGIESKLPKSTFKTTKWGFTATVKTSKEVANVVKGIAAAAEATRPEAPNAA